MNASVQCVLSWRPFVEAISVDGSHLGANVCDEYTPACVVARFRELRLRLLQKGEANGVADIEPFMQWVFELSDVRLRDGKIEV